MTSYCCGCRARTAPKKGDKQGEFVVDFKDFFPHHYDEHEYQEPEVVTVEYVDWDELATALTLHFTNGKRLEIEGQRYRDCAAATGFYDSTHWVGRTLKLYWLGPQHGTEPRIEVF